MVTSLAIAAILDGQELLDLCSGIATSPSAATVGASTANAYGPGSTNARRAEVVEGCELALRALAVV